jgi:hypothetical protein
LDNTTREWTTVNGINGRKFTSKTNGNSIFLPAAGLVWDGELYDVGSFSCYLSSTPYGEDSAYYLSIYSGGASWSSYYRSYGRSVRPVR